MTYDLKKAYEIENINYYKYIFLNKLILFIKILKVYDKLII